MEVPIVLHHAGVLDLGVALAVELIQCLRLEGLGDLQGAVAAEIEEDDTIAVLYGPHRLAAFGDDKGRQVLVDGTGLAPQCLNRLLGAGKEPALSEDMGLPAALDHVPVGVVAVHRDDHSPAAAGDPGVKIPIVEGGEERLEGKEVLKGAELADITAIEQRVNPHPLHPLSLGLGDHRLEVVDVGVDVAVAEQADEVHRRVVLLGVGNQMLPDLTIEHGAA